MPRDPEMDRESFLEHLSTNESLETRFGKGAGVFLAEGRIPPGYAIHRVEPLFRGGTNRLSNLLLVREVFRRNYSRLLCWYEDGCNPFLIGMSGKGLLAKLFGRGKTQTSPTNQVVVCPNCNSRLEQDSPVASRIDAAVRKREPIAIECDNCRQFYIWGPPRCVTRDYYCDTAPRCPKAGCDGWVVYVQESPTSSFWGCGECGEVWRTQQELFSQIQKICRQYTYRTACYARAGNKILGAPLEKEPQDYRERVIDEDW